MRVTMLLADAAQVESGKLYILGGGWSRAHVPCPPLALAVKIEVPFDLSALSWSIVLLDEDSHPVVLPPESSPLRIEGHMELASAEDRPVGADLDVPLAVNFGPLPLPPGRYTWQLELQGEADPNWSVSFTLE